MLRHAAETFLHTLGSVRRQPGRLITGVLLLAVLTVVLPGHRHALAWIAEIEQPCQGTDICGFHVEVTTADGAVVLGGIDVPAAGCGTHRLDISALLSDVDDSGLSPPQLRVWSVNCAGIPSASYDWVIVDLDSRCSGMTRTSHDGKANHDSLFDISDPIYLLSYLFLGGPRPCSNSADANNDGNLDLSDAIFLLELLFDQ